MHLKYLVIISGFAVGSTYTMKNEQSKLVPATSLEAIERPNLIPITSLSTEVPHYKNNKQKSKKLTVNTLISVEKYNKIAVYIETRPNSKTKPRLEHGRTITPETISNAIEQKKKCFYYPEDGVIFRDMRNERWHVPFILITDEPNPSVLIHG